MMKRLNIYSELLKYPYTEDYYQYLELLDDSSLCEIKEIDIKTLQEEYVNSFDFNEKATLFISVHITSNEEERKRLILALNEFLNSYEIERADKASPDYLPDILNAFQKAIESKREDIKSLEFLNNLLIKATDKIATSLEVLGSPYAKLLRSLNDELQLILKVEV